MNGAGCYELSVTYKDIDTLTAFERNARTHSKAQIRQIANSIKEFGFTNPVLINVSGMIVAGHGRVQAAKQIGMVQVPTICLSELSSDQIRAYVIADNRLAEKAGWEDSILKIELQHLITLDSGFDVTLTGFEIPEIDLILADEGVEPDPADAIEVCSGIPVTRAGDLWLLSKHRVFCGSALDAASYTTLMETRRADVVFIDPPYNVIIDGNVCGIGFKGPVRHREFSMAAGEMSETEFTSFLSKAFELLARHSSDGSIHFVAMDWRHIWELTEAGKHAYSELLNLCVWAKNNGGMGSFYRSQHELVFVFKSGTGKHRNNIQLGKYGRYRTNVWTYSGVNTLSKQSDEGNFLAMHPTVKPIALVADAILDCSARGDVVLDSFLGSGTTLMAAERTGRVCFGMELDPLYVDTVIKRWQTYTGDIAVNLATGETFSDQEAKRG